MNGFCFFPAVDIGIRWVEFVSLLFPFELVCVPDFGEFGANETCDYGNKIRDIEFTHMSQYTIGVLCGFLLNRLMHSRHRVLSGNACFVVSIRDLVFRAVRGVLDAFHITINKVAIAELAEFLSYLGFVDWQTR